MVKKKFRKKSDYIKIRKKGKDFNNFTMGKGYIVPANSKKKIYTTGIKIKKGRIVKFSLRRDK